MQSTVVALACLLVGAGAAFAGPKLALPAIEGDDSGAVREAVTEALDGKELSIVGTKETNRVVDKLKIELGDVTDKQAKKLQAELEADAVVLGTLGKDGGTKILRFKLYVNGKKAKGFSIQFSNPKSKKFKETLHNTMVEKLSVAGVDESKAKDKDKDTDKPKAKKKDKAKENGNGDGDGEVAEDDKPKKKKKKKTIAENGDGEDEPKKKKKRAKKPEPKADGEPDEGDPKPEKGDKETASLDGDEGGEGDDEGSITVRVRPKHTANTNAVRVDVGVSASARSLTFTFTPELASDGNEPKPFRPGPVPGARVSGEIYPLAFGDPKAFAAGLGVAFHFDQVLSSKVQTTLEPDSVGRVKQQTYMVGARYRLALGKNPTSPTISVGAGYGRRTFVVKSGLMDRNNLDLPDTDYKYIAPFLGTRIPFTANIALLVQGDAMLVQDAGPISRGDSYGRAKVFGFEAQGGLDIVLGNRFAVRLMFEMSQIGFAFTGGGDKANNRDMDPTTVDIGGALDRSLGGVGTLAFTY
jgi:hypothetical protein